MTSSLRPDEFAAMATLGDIARHHGQTRPERFALAFEGRETRFSALDRQTNQAANALEASGVRRGDAIAYFGKNSDRYFELLLAASKAGAFIAPIGWRLTATEVAYIVKDS